MESTLDLDLSCSLGHFRIDSGMLINSPRDNQSCSRSKIIIDRKMWICFYGQVPDHNEWKLNNLEIILYVCVLGRKRGHMCYNYSFYKVIYHLPN